MPTDDRQTGELHSMAKDTGGLVSGILGFLIGPIMLFWAVLCWISNLAWLQANLPPGGVGLRFWTIPRFVGYRNFQVLCLWWSVAVILFVAGAGALWIGIRRLFLPSDCSE